MELIIDRGFIDNFYLAYNEDDAYHEDIKHFYKEIKGWKIITNYESEEEFILEAENSNPFLHWFIETNVPEIEFRNDLLREIKSEGYYSKGSPFKLLFCDSETHSEKHGFLTIKSDDIAGTWIYFFHMRSEYHNERKTTKDRSLKREERFEQWEDVQSYRHPFHGLIILDRYLLVDSPNQRMVNNLFPMLKNLICGFRNLIDIIIITEKLNSKLVDVHNKINGFLRDELKLVDYHLSIIQVPPNKKAEHIRRIYTNYLSIESENSLNIFKDNGVMMTRTIKYLSSFYSMTGISGLLKKN